MSIIVRYGAVIAVAAGGVTLAAAGVLGTVAVGWWVLWGALAVITAGAHLYRTRAGR
ncbi:hypothetical protein [Streptomyces subrutilus]|uniref:hypothetical protein n=1 Tax=Streptomyces subrutilus TaxID=36818 RepID=UPI0033D6A5BE